MKILCLDQSPEHGKVPTDAAWHRTGNNILYSENSYERVSINLESSIIRMKVAKTISPYLSVTNSQLIKVSSISLIQFPIHTQCLMITSRNLPRKGFSYVIP